MKKLTSVFIIAGLLLTALPILALAAHDEVTLCHEAGTTAEYTITASGSAVDAHLAHGDILGECGDDVGAQGAPPLIHPNSPLTVTSGLY